MLKLIVHYLLWSYYKAARYQEKGYENVWFIVEYKSPSSTMKNKMNIDIFDIKSNNLDLILSMIKLLYTPKFTIIAAP